MRRLFDRAMLAMCLTAALLVTGYGLLYAAGFRINDTRSVLKGFTAYPAKRYGAEATLHFALPIPKFSEWQEGGGISERVFVRKIIPG